MKESTRPLSTTVVIVLCSLGVLVLLALVPMVQMWFAYTFMDVEGFKAYLSSQPVAFYQFVLTAFAVLAAIGGYLTYRSRQDAKAEGEDLCRSIAADFKSVADEEMRRKKEEFDAYVVQLRKAMETELQRFTQVIGEHSERIRKTSDEQATRVQRTGEEEESRLRKVVDEKVSQFQSVQLPQPGESLVDKAAREDYNEGIRLQASSEHQKASSKFREAIAKRPDYAEARASLGYELAREGKWDEAFAELRLAVRLKPGDAQMHFLLGACLGWNGQIREALSELREAVALSPGEGSFHGALGHGLLQGGDTANATLELEEAVRLKPESVTAMYDLARAHAKQNNHQKAAEYLRRAIGLNQKYLKSARTDANFATCQSTPEFIAILGTPPYDEPKAECPGDATGPVPAPTGESPKTAPNAPQAPGTSDQPKP